VLATRKLKSAIRISNLVRNFFPDPIEIPVVIFAGDWNYALMFGLIWNRKYLPLSGMFL
jgi:hypothetical protein